MHTIEQYIQQLFEDLPQTPEIKRIKNDLLMNAQDRYDEYLREGKTESEAVGLAIMEIGEREELFDAFGYNQETDLKDYSTNSLEEAQAYIALNQRESLKVGIGIATILTSLGLLISLSTFGLEHLGAIFLLLGVAGAVALFIVAGMNIERFEQSKIKGDLFYLSEEDTWMVEDQFDRFEHQNRFRIPLGVMLCILCPIPIMLFAYLEQELLLVRFGVFSLLFLLSIGIFQFVRYGFVHSAYEKILNIGEHTVEEIAFQERLEPIAGIYWLVVTLIYFVWSFTTMNWGFTWIIWPIGGILWAIITILIKLFFDK